MPIGRQSAINPQIKSHFELSYILVKILTSLLKSITSLCNNLKTSLKVFSNAYCVKKNFLKPIFWQNLVDLEVMTVKANIRLIAFSIFLWIQCIRILASRLFHILLFCFFFPQIGSNLLHTNYVPSKTFHFQIWHQIPKMNQLYRAEGAISGNLIDIKTKL